MDQLHLTSAIIDFDRAEIRRGPMRFSLTPNEASVLRILASSPGVTVAREVLEQQALGYAAGVDSRALLVCVRRLRAKIEEDAENPRHLLTVRGHGFRLEVTAGLHHVTRAEPLVGRDRDLRALRALLDRHPWVSVVGPSGVGKSALVRAFVAGERTLPTVWVSLRGLSVVDAEAALAQALGARRGAVPRWAVTSILPELSRLVVLDDLDRGDAERARWGELLRRWIHTAPEARFLTIGLASVGHAPEVVQVLEPLPPDDIEELLRSRCPVALPPRLPPDLLSLLGGLPAAAELAAERLLVLTAEELLRRLRADLADQGALERSAPALGALLTRSLDGLAAEDRSLLLRCACFAGPFGVSDAEWASAPVPAMEGLLRLRSRALLQREPGADRLQVLDPVRRYVLAHAAPGALAIARETHARWVLSASAARVEALAALGPDPGTPSLAFSELRAALAVAQPDLHARLVRAAILLMDELLPVGERLALLDEALAARLAPPLARDLLIERAEARLHAGLTDAAAADATAVIATPEGDVVAMRAGLVCATVARLRGEHDVAEVWLSSALSGPAPLARRARLELGVAQRAAGRFDEASVTLRALLEAPSAASDPKAHLAALIELAAVEIERGQLVFARTLTERSVRLAREQRHARFHVMGQLNLGGIALLEGDDREAQAALAEAARLAEESQLPALGAQAHLWLGTLLVLSGKAVRGLELVAHATDALLRSGMVDELRAAQTVRAWLLLAERDELGARLAAPADPDPALAAALAAGPQVHPADPTSAGPRGVTARMVARVSEFAARRCRPR